MGIKKYRPSNGTEGEIFIGHFCNHCRHDDEENDIFCEILARTMVFEIEDNQYPEEWQYDEEGKPTCTAYEGRG